MSRLSRQRDRKNVFKTTVVALPILCAGFSMSRLPAFANSNSNSVQSVGRHTPTVQLVWDKKSTVIVDNHGGTYPRLLRLKEGKLLCAYDVTDPATGRREQVVRISANDGSTWGSPITIASLADNDVANGQMVQLTNGTILCAYRVVGNTKTLEVSQSKDGGHSWNYLSTIVRSQIGVWEPFLYLLPNGQIQVYYSSEAYNTKYPQVIEMQDSVDGGKTWKDKHIISENQYSRDGMFSVVSLGSHRLLGTMEATDALNPFVVKYVESSNDGRTWGPRNLLYAPKDGNKIAASPFVVRAGNGDLVVSFQTNQYGNQDNAQDVEMETLVSADGGKSWSNPSIPFPVDTSNGQSVMWNSLFVLNGTEILAASSVNLNDGPGAIEIKRGQFKQ